MTTPLVRTATLADVAAVAHVHWDSWHATYRGVFKQATFDAFPLAAREALWHSTVLVIQRAPEQRQQLLVACESDAPHAPLLGFAALGPLRANGTLQPAAHRGELRALYLRPDVQRRGIGSALWRASATWLAAAGFSEMYVWALAINAPANAFYQARGCTRVDHRSFDADGLRFDENGWFTPLPRTAANGEAAPALCKGRIDGLNKEMAS